MAEPKRYRLAGLPVDGATVRRLAVEAECCPRSIIAELRAALGEGPPVRGVAGQRVRRVLRRRGFLPSEPGNVSQGGQS